MKKQLSHRPIGPVPEFKELLENFCALLNRERIHVAPYRSDWPVHFSGLPLEKQQEILGHFRSYFAVCQETLTHTPSLRDDKVFLWQMFKKLKVHPPSGLMTQIRDGEVIEIYNTQFIQIFRNLRFFEICSYTLDELLCRPFWELVAREERITSTLIEQTSLTLSGAAPDLFEYNVPLHQILEVASVSKNRVTLQQRIGAALRDPDGTIVSIAALLHIQDCVSTASRE